MRIGILITARLGSSRLPRKHLQPCAGQPAIYWLLERLRREFSQELCSGQAILAIATTDEQENQAFEQFAPLGVKVFCGSKKNIPLRHYQAAQALGCEAVVSVDGDDILCAREGLRAVYEQLQAGASLVRTEGLPFGMNAWGYATTMLGNSLEHHMDDVLETGWGRIFDFGTCVVKPYVIEGNSEEVRFTLDYTEDLALFDAVVSALGEQVLDADAQTIVRCLLDRGLQEITKDRVQEYWDNFRKEQAKDAEQSETSL